MILFRSICKELYTCLLAIILVLLVIFITNQFVHYLKIAAQGQITMIAVMKVMSLQIPLLLGYLLPLAMYLSILLVFARLYLDSEMAVMQACGVSRLQLMGIVLVFAAGVTVVVGVLMLWAEPRIEDHRIRVMEEAVSSASLDKLVPKRFQSLGKHGVFYAEKVSRKHPEMWNVFLALKTKPKVAGALPRWDVTMARGASERHIPGMKGRFVLFVDGDRYIGTPGHNDYQHAQFERYGVRLDMAMPHLRDWPMNVPTTELWTIQHQKPKAAAELQWRIAMPLSVIILALIAFPLAQVNPRRGRFTQLLPAIIIYTAYADLMFLGRAWIQKGKVSADVGLWWLHGAFLLLALCIYLSKVRWRRYAHS